MTGAPLSGDAITVAVATMDRPEGLARALRALLDGRVLPAQMVVVDQGARDASETLRAFGGAPVPLVHLRQARRGLSVSRNAAAAATRTPALAVTDDDCVPDAGWVAAIARALASPEVDAVSGRVLPLGPPTPDTFEVSARSSERPVDFTAPVAPWEAGTGGNFAVRLDRLRAVGGYDERLGTGTPGRAAEDLDLLHRLLRAGFRVRYAPDALVLHERQPRARRLAASEGYAHGVGAMCALWARRGDAYALPVLARYLVMQARGTVGGLRARDAFELQQRARAVLGLGRGLAYGLRASGRAPIR